VAYVPVTQGKRRNAVDQRLSEFQWNHTFCLQSGFTCHQEKELLLPANEVQEISSILSKELTQPLFNGEKLKIFFSLNQRYT